MATIDTYASTNRDTFVQLTPGSGRDESGQTFTGNNQVINSVTFYMQNNGSTAGTTSTVKIYNTSAGVPVGNAIATSDAVNFTTASSSAYTAITFPFSGANRQIMANSTVYAAMLVTVTGMNIFLGVDASSATHAGQAYSKNGASFLSEGAGVDFVFIADGATIPASSMMQLF